MVKHALYKIRECINKNNYPVLIVLQVHDEINTLCSKEFAKQWSIIMKDLMEKSALTVIPEGLLKAEMTISEVWEKE